MPTSCARSTISQEKLASGSGLASSAAARGATSSSTKRWTVSRIARCSSLTMKMASMEAVPELVFCVKKAG
jgi:hypothetical protein